MRKVIVAGSGTIGRLVAVLLANTDDYHVHVVDKQLDTPVFNEVLSSDSRIDKTQLDLTDTSSLANLMIEEKADAVVACLPLSVNLRVAEAAKKANVHYFDLTEDVAVSQAVCELARDSQKAFVPQCGLAPGFVSIAAAHLMAGFDRLDKTQIRVGALPKTSVNALGYALTWSSDGLINEYSNPCYCIDDGTLTEAKPLEGLETIQLDGIAYEAFNTSGGLGRLAKTFDGKLNQMNYKTLRYPGHCQKMRLLLHTLKLSNDRETLKRILENALPSTEDDVVIVHVAVSGYRNGLYIEDNLSKKIYPKEIAKRQWTAIQVTTASSVCAVLDEVMSNEKSFSGIVHQDEFNLTNFLSNRFGRYYA